jgi:hypothetical protein
MAGTTDVTTATPAAAAMLGGNRQREADTDQECAKK